MKLAPGPLLYIVLSHKQFPDLHVICAGVRTVISPTYSRYHMITMADSNESDKTE